MPVVTKENDEPFLASLRKELFQKISQENKVDRIHSDEGKIWSDVDTMLSTEYEKYKLSIIERDTGVSLKGKKLLEIGSGLGFFVITARAQGIDAIGTEPYSDFYEEDQKIGKKLRSHFGLSPDDISNAAAEALPFPDHTFDVISSYYVFEHVQNPLKVLQECIRVLKPGGFIHFVFPNYGSFWEGHYGIPWIPNLNQKWGCRYVKWLWNRSPIMVKGLNLLNEKDLREMIDKLRDQAELVTIGKDIFKKEISSLSFNATGSIQRVQWIFKLMKWTGLLKIFVWWALKFGFYTPFYLTLRKKKCPMSDKALQIKNSFIYFIPVVLGAILPLLTLSIFTRILTKEEFGILALARVFALLASGIANVGLLVIYERNFFQYKEENERATLLFSITSFVSVLCGLFICVTFFFKEGLSKVFIGTSIYGDIVFWSLITYCLMSLREYFLIYFKNSENAKDFVRFTLFESLLIAVFSIVFVAFLKMGVMGMVWGQLLGVSLVFVYLAFKFLKSQALGFSKIILWESLRKSIYLTPRIFMKTIATQFDKYMIGLLETLGGVGIYNIGQRIAFMVNNLMNSLKNVSRPQVYKRMFKGGKTNEGEEKIGPYLTPFFYVSIFFALGMVLFSEEVITIVTPPSYHQAIEVVIILSLFYASMFLRMQPQIIMAQKTHLISVIAAFDLILNIILNIPFILKWGALGAAWATLISGAITAVVTYVVSQRAYFIKWEYKKMGAIVFILLLSAIAMLVMRDLGLSYPVKLLAKIILLVLYGVVGRKLNLLTKENYILFKTIIFSKKPQEQPS